MAVRDAMIAPTHLRLTDGAVSPLFDFSQFCSPELFAGRCVHRNGMNIECVEDGFSSAYAANTVDHIAARHTLGRRRRPGLVSRLHCAGLGEIERIENVVGSTMYLDDVPGYAVSEGPRKLAVWTSRR
jgi:hypothetical protein